MLLADLLVHLGQPLSTDRLIDHLWGQRPPATAANTLQGKVSQLRKVLEAAQPGGRELLTLHPAGYVLQIAPSAVDVHQFSALAERARATADARVRADLLGEALKLWRGPAVADFRDEPFALGMITRLEEERVVALEDRAEARLEAGENAALTGELGELVKDHPLRERLSAVYMRALYQAGRQSEALEEYQSLRERLAHDLGVDPNPKLDALHQAILEQKPGLEAPPVPELAERRPPSGLHPRKRTNLPAQLTELIGRSDAVEEVIDRLRTHRLVCWRRAA
jgi:DNA-binding SARP family transcriptional activator